MSAEEPRYPAAEWLRDLHLADSQTLGPDDVPVGVPHRLFMNGEPFPCPVIFRDVTIEPGEPITVWLSIRAQDFTYDTDTKVITTVAGKRVFIPVGDDENLPWERDDECSKTFIEEWLLVPVFCATFTAGGRP